MMLAAQAAVSGKTMSSRIRRTFDWQHGQYFVTVKLNRLLR
jgi:hypothetical protein